MPWLTLLPPGVPFPRFSLFQKTDRGEIIGFQYIRDTNPAAKYLGSGWHYFIAVDPAIPTFKTEPIEAVSENQVEV